MKIINYTNYNAFLINAYTTKYCHYFAKGEYLLSYGMYIRSQIDYNLFSCTSDARRIGDYYYSLANYGKKSKTLLYFMKDIGLAFIGLSRCKELETVAEFTVVFESANLFDPIESNLKNAVEGRLNIFSVKDLDYLDKYIKDLAVGNPVEQLQGFDKVLRRVGKYIFKENTQKRKLMLMGVLYLYLYETNRVGFIR